MAYNLLDNKNDITKKSLAESLKTYTFVTASAGNHGISMAVGARLFGSKAVVFLSKTVPKSFSRKLESYGARVVFSGKNYEESMRDAENYSKKSNHVLLSDSTTLVLSYFLALLLSCPRYLCLMYSRNLLHAYCLLIIRAVPLALLLSDPLRLLASQPISHFVSSHLSILAS